MNTLSKNIYILTLFLIVTASFNVYGKVVDCSKHRIYCQIKKNNNNLDDKYAMKLSNIIYKATSRYNVPPRIFTAILSQESRYSLKAKGCHKGLVKKVVFPEGTKNVDNMTVQTTIVYEEVKICSDFGIGQIYFKTANLYDFDVTRLTTDLEYSVNAAAEVLADFMKRYKNKEIDWWTRYNASSKDKRTIYRHLVSRYL